MKIKPEDRLDNEGNYILPDEFVFNDCVPSFADLWKDEIQFFPQVPNDWKQQDTYREFAKRVYDCLTKNGIDIGVMKIIQETVNEAYNDGIEDGQVSREDVIQECIQSLRNL